METKAILVVSFGTTSEKTCLETIGAIESDVKAAFPSWDVHRAFTSNLVIRQLAQRNISVNTPEQALQMLWNDGFRQVWILPTFLAPGGEYRRLLQRIALWREQFSLLAIAKPLLYDSGDIQAMAQILAETYPAADGNAIVFMGHGTDGDGNESYGALEAAIHSLGASHTFIALLKGQPDLESVLTRIQGRYASVSLVPLMLSVGSHAAKHMAGEDSHSWKNRCTAAGLEVKCIMTGLGESPQVRRIYLKHLQKEIHADR